MGSDVPTKPKFDEEKATEEAMVLLSEAGGEMNYEKMLKLLYMAEREAITKQRLPISYDFFVSMERGPVPSMIKNMIEGDDKQEAGDYWDQFIERNSKETVRLKKDPEISKLSETEKKILRKIYEKFKDYSKKEVNEYTHTFDEWDNPGISRWDEPNAFPITYERIMEVKGFSPKKIEKIKSHMHRLRDMQEVEEKVLQEEAPLET